MEFNLENLKIIKDVELISIYCVTSEIAMNNGLVRLGELERARADRAGRDPRRPGRQSESHHYQHHWHQHRARARDVQLGGNLLWKLEKISFILV